MMLGSRVRTVSLIACLLMSVIAGLTQAADERKGCSVCGMYLDAYASTMHVIVFKDGSREETCSIVCAASIYDKDRTRIKQVLVADYLTTDLVPADQAVYLEGSDVPGVMSATSRIAFKSKDEAAAFRKKHGGTLTTFPEAVKHQLAE